MHKYGDVIKWKHFPRYWHFVREIHRSPLNSPHKGQWRGALMFSLICTWTNGWINNRDADDLRRHRAHYDVTEMYTTILFRSTGSTENLNCTNQHGPIQQGINNRPLVGYPNINYNLTQEDSTWIRGLIKKYRLISIGIPIIKIIWSYGRLTFGNGNRFFKR